MKYTLTILFLVSYVFSFAQQPVDSRQQEIVFHQVNVIPMESEQVMENQTVVVEDGRITAISDTKDANYNEDAIVVDAKGRYLIPGLAEMHAHVPPVEEFGPMEEVLLLFVTNGITTIRGMLGHPRHLELRDKIQAGEIPGPRFYTTGPSFNGQSVKTAAEAAAMVRQQKEAGYDYLKLHPGLTKETFESIARTAKEVNIPFVGHVSFDVGIWRAIDAGYSSIDHLDGFIEGLVPGIDTVSEGQTGLFGMFIADKADTTKIPRLMQGLKESNTWVVPTQALAERWFSPVSAESLQQAPEMKYMPAETMYDWVRSKKSLQANPKYDTAAINYFIELRRKLILACHRQGVGLLLGCDAPQVFNVPGFSTHQELQYLVNAGLSPYEALRTGTVNVAAYLNQSDDTGTIHTGAVSDLILLNGNPLEDISQTQNIEGVMIGNLWLSKEYIEQEQKKLEKR